MNLFSCLNDTKIETTKLVGVTTDGKNANTGKDGCLWKLLKEHTVREILDIWYVFHLPDLALESVQSPVPELSIWMSNVLAVSIVFRTSSPITKLLHQV